jgi:Mn2+/Fe2+ NRAMP family transporter
MKTQTYSYIALVGSIAVIVLNISEKDSNVMNFVGVVLGIAGSIGSIVLLILQKRNKKIS